MSDPSPGPLAGIRVIDVGTRISAPFCAGLLGELGADVIKVELPGEGDFMRTIGPFVPVDDGPGLLALLGGRGAGPTRRHLRPAQARGQGALPAAGGDGRRAVRELPARHHGALGPRPRRPARRPRLRAHQRLRADGPVRPAARARPARHRLRRPAPSDRRSRPPACASRRHRSRTTSPAPSPPSPPSPRSTDATRRGAGGDVIDAPLYGSVLRILEWTLAGYDRLGIVRQREGNRLSHSAPLDNYPTADGFFICIVAGSDANFHRLCQAMDATRPGRGPALRHAGRAGGPRRRDQRHRGRVDRRASPPRRSRLAASSTTSRSAPPTARPTSSPTPTWRPAATSSPVDDPVIGPVRQQAPFPRLAKHPAPVPRGAPRLGEHNHEVWCDLVGLSEDELADLVERGVV